MKKHLAYLVAVVLLITSITSCEKKPVNDSETNANSSSVVTEESTLINSGIAEEAQTQGAEDVVEEATPTIPDINYTPIEELSYDYDVSTQGMIITGFTDNSSMGEYDHTELAIPEEINGVPVTAIKKEAFDNLYNLSYVYLPKTIKIIGQEAFENCTGITEITIPEDTEVIEAYAFRGCENLADVVFPEYSPEVEFGAFYSTPFYEKVCAAGDFIVYGDYLEEYVGTSKEVVIPDGIVTIGTRAFSFPSQVENVIMPDSVTRVLGNAFYKSETVKSVDFSPNITYYTDYSVAKNETSLYADNSDTFIINEGVLLKYQGTDAAVTIPDGVTCVGAAAFSKCATLESVIIPEGVVAICSDAFLACENLSEVSLPDGLLSIHSSAFYECEALKNIDIPDSVTEIGSSAFARTGLTTFTIPPKVTALEHGVLSTCRSLENVVFHDRVTAICDYAFFACYSLKTLTLPESVLGIGSHTFESSGLENIDIPDSMIYIGTYAFCETNLTECTIPMGAKVFSSTFKECRKLTQLTVPDTATLVDDMS